MKKWKAIAGILLVFLLGALSGVLGTYAVYQQRMEGVMRDEPGRAREFIVRRLGRDLSLDPGQSEQLRAIVRETHAQLRELRKKIRPETEEIMARSQDRVRAILRPDQREKYEKIIAEHRKRREGEENSR
jgi:Spy/CpxP family protein refolding chaperone